MIAVLRDVLWIGSISAIATGLWWICPAASLIGTGGIILAILVLPRR